MSLWRIIFCLYFYCFSLWAHAENTTDHNMMVSMRDSGYTMGDQMKMRVIFSLPNGKVIDEESLPLVGRVSPWLDIREIQLVQHQQQGQQVATLDITWQIFATVEISQRLKTPEIRLKTAGDQAGEVTIPPQAFYYSPILPMPPLKNIKRRANLPPPSFDTTKPIVTMSVSFSLLCLCGLAWLWLKDLLPWAPYQSGPMIQLSRKMNAASLQAAGSTFSQQQLRDIHAALNQSAGISLYPHNLSQLFRHAPYFANEQHAVMHFFNASWAMFYAENPSNQHDVDTVSTMQWIRRVALAERLFRRKN